MPGGLVRKHWIASIVLMASALAAFGQIPEWKQYEFPDDGFSISAASRPKLEKQMVETAAGQMEMRTYSLDVAVWAVGVIVNDFSAFPNVPAKEMLQAAKNGSVQEVKGRLVSEKEIFLEGNSGIEYEIKTDSHHSICRIYYVKGRLITLISVAPLSMPYFPATDQFFNSLHFLKPQPDGKADSPVKANR